MTSSNSPKSFKQMTFPPARQGTNAVYALLPPPPPPRSITATEAKRRADQLEEMKVFCNAERCPICDAQLDGRIGYDSATLYCAANGEAEYKAHYKYGLSHPHWSVVTYYTTHFGFEIESSYVEGNMFKNTIYKVDLQLNKKYRQLDKKKLLDYEGAKLLLKKNLSEEQILEKIKLYTLFS